MSTPGRELVASDVPGTPARVMNAGTALSREVGQELAAVVERTARRERLRRRTGLVTVPGTLALYGLFVWATAPSDADVESIVAAFCGLAALPLALHLLWGARNRALLDVAAADGAVSRAVLADAVQRMRRDRLGPSSALREALAATATTRP
jgi:hypothetical protein